MRLRFSLVVLAGLALGGPSAFGQVVTPPQPTAAAFKGVHRHESANGRAETVTITDGKNHLRITEQEYRERGYAPEFEHLPTVIVRRLPVRIRVPPEHLDDYER
jgi:hypothetical protein